MVEKISNNFSVTHRDLAHYETVKSPEHCSLDVQQCLEIYIALDKSLCAKTRTFKYEYQVLHLKQMFSGEQF